MALHNLTIEHISGWVGLLLSHSWWQNSEESGDEGMPWPVPHSTDSGIEWVLASASAALSSALRASCSSMYWLGGVLTVYSNRVGTCSPIRSAKGWSWSSISISSPVLGVAGSVAGGMSKKYAESIHGGIGIGDCDICNRLAKLVIGDCTSKMDLVPFDSTGGVNKGWVGLVCLSKGGVVGEGVPTLVDMCDNGEVILLFDIVGDTGSEDIWW